MRHYEASARVDAVPEQVWAVLSDVERWPEWDSGVAAVEGRATPDGKVTIRSHAAPGRAFPVRVTELEPPTRLRLSGGMPLGLFRGVRTFDITPAPEGGSTFRVREEYTGALLPLIWRSMPDLQQSFDQFADGLKQRVESTAAAG
jgi:hypothetical protein